MVKWSWCEYSDQVNDSYILRSQFHNLEVITSSSK